MIIESLKLNRFRNYDSLKLEFDTGTNIFYGDNAQGKTNILEAIYLCGTTKSHRGSKDREMIQFGQEEAHICMGILKNHAKIQVDMHLKKNKAKGIAINGVPIRKASELFGIANFIFFSPEDLNIIKSGPAERRRFLDLELCQLNKIYLYHLTNYNKIIVQRNKLLKEAAFHPEYFDMLEVYDSQMALHGSKVIEEREKFILHLNEVIRRVHAKLSGGREELRLDYDRNVQAEHFFEQLQRNRDRDVHFKMSTVGPHKDDIRFCIGDLDVRKFGSQGQQRTAALSLKLAEIELVKQEIRDTPILLLDDVLSELDSKRQHYLLDSIGAIQTFITCTGIDDFIENQFEINHVFHVADGVVYE
ncbi:MAG: DNA replication/repair protein RecF [Lachnospiraceae bacterium]|nr:DNA replication/repair protein RecF [Robinsoniella sp.]MDY3767510.1 DNA replication/repair protein RecF [Lachnospiraceae bacterium]